MRIVNVFMAVFLVVAVAGCKRSKSGAGSSGSAAELLKGYPYELALFTPAKLSSAHGAGKGFDAKYPAYEWRFETKAKYAELVAFYDSHYPAATRVVDAEDVENGAAEPSIDWTMHPSADPDEDVIIGVQHTGYVVQWSAPAERLPK